MLKRLPILRVGLMAMIVATSKLGDIHDVHAQPADAKRNAAGIELSDANYASWRAHIMPKQSELKWQLIPWHTTFKDGILAAHDAGKPLLFWTMNGHPLGCT